MPLVGRHASNTVLLLVIFAGCKGGGDPGSPGGADDAGTTADGGLTATPCGVYAVAGSFLDLSISISSDKCVYHSGEAGVFRYTITVGPQAPAVPLPSYYGCGKCGGYSSDPLSFVTAGIRAPGTSYCVCDVGCCPPVQPANVALTRGFFSSQLDWPGLTWNGPSDTNEQLGPPFAPGRYDVVVSFQGFAQGRVEARLPIEVVP